MLPLTFAVLLNHGDLYYIIKLHCADTWLLASVAFNIADYVYLNLASGFYHYRGTAHQDLQFICTCLDFCWVSPFPSARWLFILSLVDHVNHQSLKSSVIQAGRITLNHRCRAARTVCIYLPNDRPLPCENIFLHCKKVSENFNPTAALPCKTAVITKCSYQLSGCICLNDSNDGIQVLSFTKPLLHDHNNRLQSDLM